MAQVTSGKIARCDWLLAWQDFSVMTEGIMKLKPKALTNSKSRPKALTVRPKTLTNSKS